MPLQPNCNPSHHFQVCKHIYDRDSIRGFIEQHAASRKLCQCPVSNCQNKKRLSMDDMEEYPQFFDEVRH